MGVFFTHGRVFKISAIVRWIHGCDYYSLQWESDRHAKIGLSSAQEAIKEGTGGSNCRNAHLELNQTSVEGIRAALEAQPP